VCCGCCMTLYTFDCGQDRDAIAMRICATAYSHNTEERISAYVRICENEAQVLHQLVNARAGSLSMPKRRTAASRSTQQRKARYLIESHRITCIVSCLLISSYVLLVGLRGVVSDPPSLVCIPCIKQHLIVYHPISSHLSCCLPAILVQTSSVLS
jgi:hypothetical protein